VVPVDLKVLADVDADLEEEVEPKVEVPLLAANKDNPKADLFKEELLLKDKPAALDLKMPVLVVFATTKTCAMPKPNLLPEDNPLLKDKEETVLKDNKRALLLNLPVDLPKPLLKLTRTNLSPSKPSLPRMLPLKNASWVNNSSLSLLPKRRSKPVRLLVCSWRWTTVS
jgi:hypothetical protein